MVSEHDASYDAFKTTEPLGVFAELASEHFTRFQRTTESIYRGKTLYSGDPEIWQEDKYVQHVLDLCGASIALLEAEVESERIRRRALLADLTATPFASGTISRSAHKIKSGILHTIGTALGAGSPAQMTAISTAEGIYTGLYERFLNLEPTEQEKLSNQILSDS